MLETPTVVKQGNNYGVQYGTDANIFVEFYEDAIENTFASTEKGIKVYDDYILVKVMIPGGKGDYIEKIAVLDKESKEWHYFDKNNGEPTWQTRFPTQWNQFKSSLEQTPDGFPVTECPFFTKAFALNLKANKIYTLEQIADLPDQNIGILGLGGRAEREKVRTFLNKGKDAADITKLFAEIDRLKADNEVMKEQLAAKDDISPSQKPKLKMANN